MAMECKVCESKDVWFVSKWTDSENEYMCLDCGRTIIAKPENEDRDVKV